MHLKRGKVTAQTAHEGMSTLLTDMLEGCSRKMIKVWVEVDVVSEWTFVSVSVRDGMSL